MPTGDRNGGGRARVAESREERWKRIAEIFISSNVCFVGGFGDRSVAVHEIKTPPTCAYAYVLNNTCFRQVKPNDDVAAKHLMLNTKSWQSTGICFS